MEGTDGSVIDLLHVYTVDGSSWGEIEATATIGHMDPDGHNPANVKLRYSLTGPSSDTTSEVFTVNPGKVVDGTVVFTVSREGTYQVCVEKVEVT